MRRTARRVFAKIMNGSVEAMAAILTLAKKVTSEWLRTVATNVSVKTLSGIAPPTNASRNAK